MGLLLIGCGYWGKNWASTLHGMGQLAAICEGATDRHAELAEAYPNTPIVATLDDALAMEGITGAVVATPAPSHKAIGQQLLAQGIPTLIEKPLALSEADANALVDAAKATQTLLAVGHICLFYPGMTQLKDWITSGKLGQVQRVICVRQKMGIIRNEENVWWSFAPHDISMVLDLIEAANGSLPTVSVTGISGQCDLGRAGLEDTVTAELQADSGQKATVQVSWLAAEKQFETTVIGTKGVAYLEHAGKPHGPAQTATFTPIVDTPDGNKAPDFKAKEILQWDTIAPPLKTQADTFIAAIQHGTAIPNTAANGQQVVSILAQGQALLEDQSVAVTSPSLVTA